MSRGWYISLSEISSCASRSSRTAAQNALRLDSVAASSAATATGTLWSH